MRSIVFNVRPEVSPEERESLLTRLKEFPGIHRAAALSPKAKSSTTRQMCYAYVEDGADLEAMRSRIAELPEVESASLPAPRQLL